jgi:hypothetical protein
MGKKKAPLMGLGEGLKGFDVLPGDGFGAKCRVRWEGYNPSSEQFYDTGYMKRAWAAIEAFAVKVLSGPITITHGIGTYYDGLLDGKPAYISFPCQGKRYFEIHLKK